MLYSLRLIIERPQVSTVWLPCCTDRFLRIPDYCHCIAVNVSWLWLRLLCLRYTVITVHIGSIWVIQTHDSGNHATGSPTHPTQLASSLCSPGTECTENTTTTVISLLHVYLLPWKRVYQPPLPRNEWLLLLNYSGFQPSFHNTVLEYDHLLGNG